MAGEPTHTASEMASHAPAMLIIVCKVKYPLRFIVSYVYPITQYFESRTVQKAPLQSPHTERKAAMSPVILIIVWMKSEVSTTLCCWLCSTHCTAVRIKNCSKSTSANKIVTMENMDDFRYEGKPSRATTKWTLFAVSKDEWDTKEDTCKSMKNVLYVLRYAKRHLSG